LVVLAFLTPLGVILPRVFRSEEAWGEWDAGYLRAVLGYAPERLARGIHIWHAPAAGYSLPTGAACFGSQLVSYLVSGLLGLLLVALSVFLISKLARRNEG
jgi:hypothetical protein